MPFGLQGALATFQRMMNNLLMGLEGHASTYIDDLVIDSRSWEEHMKHLRQVFSRLKEAGWTVKHKKCQFAMDSCVYLGHIVGNGEVKPELSKIKCVESFPISKRHVRAFLGLTGYYCHFITDYTTVAAPLTDLTKKSSPNNVAWGAKCGEAFKKLKQMLRCHPVVVSPDFNGEFIPQMHPIELWELFPAR